MGEKEPEGKKREREKLPSSSTGNTREGREKICRDVESQVYAGTYSSSPSTKWPRRKLTSGLSSASERECVWCALMEMRAIRRERAHSRVALNEGSSVTRCSRMSSGWEEGGGAF